MTTQEASSTNESSQPTTAAPGDDLAQMRLDLSRMESLNNNMSAEIEFLHDQNLQILLRTNAQMWTMLIRDLRQQIDREERQGATHIKPSTAPPPESSPSPR